MLSSDSQCYLLVTPLSIDESVPVRVLVLTVDEYLLALYSLFGEANFL